MSRTTFILCAVMCLGLVFGQGPTGEINGTVTDPSGAVLPNASVRLANIATGARREVNTNGSGLYSFPALLPGTYTISVEQPGFQKQVRSDITIQVHQTARVDFSLVVGEVSQTMEVSAAAPLLAAEDATIGQVIENKRIVELPLNGRNYLQLSALTPG